MIDFKRIDDNCIIITPTNNKEKLVKDLLNTCPLKHVKFMSKEEVLEGLNFTYDISAISYLNKKYNYSFNLAKEIMNNLFQIKSYNEKLTKLYNIYLDLKENNYLKFNPYFKNIFNNKTIYIFGYNPLDKELTNNLDSINVSYTFLTSSSHSYPHEVLTFTKMEDEVKYVINKICELYLNNVSLNNIYLYKVPETYNLYLKKLLIYHNIPYEFRDNITLYETTIYKKYRSLLSDNDYTKAYELLKDEIKYDPFDALSKIVDIITKVNSLPYDIDLLDFLAKGTSLKGKRYKESLKEINDSSVITDDDYVFMLGFSLGTHPVIERDVDFYQDFEKEFLGKNTSTIKNKINEENLINFINNTKNLTITFKEKVDKQVFYLSPLALKIPLKVRTMDLDNIRYSTKLSKIEIASLYDLEKLYGIKSKYLNTYSKDELNYDIFNHKYKGLPSFDKNKEITLSYSQINEYNKCPFNYFINRILHVNIFEGNFNTSLGTLYHQILEDYSNNKHINLNDYQDYILTNFKTYKERYFVSKLLPQVEDVIKLNQDFIDKSYFDQVYAEKRYDYKIDDNSNLMGKIDKVILDLNDKGLILVDYKTGDFKFQKEKTKFGIDMQLPIYALLLKEKYPNFKNCGMYIQNVCLDKEELLGKQIYSLNGITLNDEINFKRLDPTLGTSYDDEGNLIQESKYIKGLVLNKDGSYAKKIKAYDALVFDELIKKAKEETIKVIKNIRSANFNIAPVKFANEQNSACEYCKNKDICYKKDQDIRILDYRETKDMEEN